MSKAIEFIFDFGSPSTYLAYVKLLRISNNRDVPIIWTPVLLGGIQKSCGNPPPTAFPAKEKWFFKDLEVCAQHDRVPYVRNPFFPINTLALMRGAVALKGTVKFDKYMEVVFKAMWETPQNLGDPEVMEKVLAKVELNSVEFMALISDVEVKERLKQVTEEAVERGVFGCPSFFVGDQLFFGQDRLDQVERAVTV